MNHNIINKKSPKYYLELEAKQNDIFFNGRKEPIKR